MRTISFLLFWTICWDENREWTAILSLAIPIIPLLILAELLRLAESRRLSSLSLLQSIAVTAWANEFIVKPIVNSGPLTESCDLDAAAPSTFGSIAAAVTFIHAKRLFTLRRRSLVPLISWFGAFVVLSLAHPVIGYLSWNHTFSSLAPGLLVGGFWAFVIEGCAFWGTLMPLAKWLGLENDIFSKKDTSDEPFRQEREGLLSA
jgi:hypothetical protein